MTESGIRPHKISYIKHSKIDNMFRRLTIIFLFVYIVLPQYFGLNTPGFDLTAQRMAVILLFLLIIDDKNRVQSFFKTVRNLELLPYVVLYLFVCLYTAVYRHHIGSFAYPLIEFLAMFLLIFYVKEYLNFEKMVDIICVLSFILGLLGIIEYVMQRTPFSYMETIKGLYTGGMIRSGSYRVMGPANHSLGYGLMLVVFLPVSCINTKEDRVDLFNRPFLFAILFLNVFLTGSRSTLAVVLLEVVVLFLLQERNSKKKSIVYCFIFIVFIAILLLVTCKTTFSTYILRQITSVIDEVFGTSFAVNFGANATILANSSDYRKYLPQIFGLPFLNPIIGRGSGYVFKWYVDGFYIESIDNFYVALYIRYAYTGMITYLLIILRVVFSLIKTIVNKRSGVCKAIFCGVVCYFVNLWWLDTLQTIKYVYILFALFYIYVFEHSYTNEK